MEEVQSAFATYGEVKDCFVPLDYDGNPRGFAFVLMDEENALAAIEGLDGTELGGRSLNVKKSLPKGEKAVAKGTSCDMKFMCELCTHSLTHYSVIHLSTIYDCAEVKLYVGNLSWGTEESALRELFGEYGTVVDCYLPVDRETGQHRGFAFVTMDPADAQRAADETDGYELAGRILRVNESQPKGSGRQYNNNNNYNDGYGGGDGGDGSWGGNDNY